MKRIVVLRAGALGDTVLTLPAIQALRRRYPEARIDVAGYPSLWEVAGSAIHTVLPIDLPPISDLYAGRASRPLQRQLEDVDLFVAWTTRDLSPALLALNIAFIAGSPYPPPGVHAATWLRQLLDLPAPACPLLSFEQEELHAARTVLHTMNLERPLWLHPGAGAVWKRWPAGRFATLAATLRREGHEVALIEGPADAEPVAAVQEAWPLPVLRDVSVRPLAAILSLGCGYIGNDSGVTHIAAAAGLPTIALFGPTDPASWSPLGNVTVLRACEATTSVQGQVRVCEDPQCMHGIAAEEVLAAYRAIS